MFIKFLIFWFCSFNIFLYIVRGADYVSENLSKENDSVNNSFEDYVIYGVMSEVLKNDNLNISAICENDLKNLLTSVNNLEIWAIKVLDASGTYRSGFIWGQNAWLGSKSQCDFLNKPPLYTTSPVIPKVMNKHLLPTISPIEMEYKMVFFLINSPLKVDANIHIKTSTTYRLGLCTPKSCGNDEIEILSQRFFDQRKTNFQKIFNASMEVFSVRNMDSMNFWMKPEFTLLLFGICFITVVIILFSFVNEYLKDSKMDGPKKFFQCFSIQDNVTSLFDTKTSPNAIKSINGIRTIICVWVVCFHCAYFSMYAYDNLPVYMATLENIEIQPFFALIFYVDIFFVLSALLLSYNFLKDERTLNEIRSSSYTENVKLFLKKIIHRYLRLTPAFLFVIGISHLLAIYIRESSSFYIDDTFDVYCTRQSLLRSVFYIHNIYDGKDMCINWSWYLGCDMQFFVITLFILFVYARNPVFAKFLYLGLLFVVTVFGIYLNLRINLLNRFDSLFYHTDKYYFAPWHRMHPYLAGVVVGCVMFQIKGKTFLTNYITIRGYWIGASIIIISSLFITSFREISALSLALALSFGRYFISLFNGSIVIMCHHGFGGIVNKVWSSRLCVHVNKMTYCMYLIHPVLILYFNSQQVSSLHFELPNTILPVVAIICLSYLSSLVISPLFEIPFQKLSDEYIMNKSKPVAQKAKSSVHGQ